MNLKDFEYVTTNTDDPLWFFGTRCPYPLVCPKGTKVKFKRVFSNFYGTWFEVEYQGKTRYIDPILTDGNVMIKEEKAMTCHADPMQRTVCTLYTDTSMRKYVLVNEKGDLKPL